MPKEKKNKAFDTFAWQIYREVEKFISENEAAYIEWAQARAAETKSAGSDSTQGDPGEVQTNNQKGRSL
jgi:hypothetical protein